MLTLSEAWRVLVEASTFFGSLQTLSRLPRGDGHPVYLLPGFLSDERSLRALHHWLTDNGYNVLSWAFGRNLGPSGVSLERLVDTVRDASRDYGQPVSLIGQSLGGIFAREIAREIPTHVRQVITLGSPFRRTDSNGIAPVVLRLFELINGQQADALKREAGDISTPPPVPCTAIYSRTDGVAHWRICIEDETPLTDNVEVVGSHCGMIFNPAIYHVIGDRLAQPLAQWRKFDPERQQGLLYPCAVNQRDPIIRGPFLREAHRRGWISTPSAASSRN
jgi:pimeloyl-ACP methyl ester carboxylesterase